MARPLYDFDITAGAIQLTLAVNTSLESVAMLFTYLEDDYKPVEADALVQTVHRRSAEGS